MYLLCYILCWHNWRRPITSSLAKIGKGVSSPSLKHNSAWLLKATWLNTRMLGSILKARAVVIAIAKDHSHYLQPVFAAFALAKLTTIVSCLTQWPWFLDQGRCRWNHKLMQPFGDLIVDATTQWSPREWMICILCVFCRSSGGLHDWYNVHLNPFGVGNWLAY